MGTIFVSTGLVRGGSLWANWDEASEDTLSVDQDGDGTEDTYICFMENPVAGGDETGRGGGLSGADLVLTQAGNVAGATGSPPYRSFDGSDDTMEMTANAFDTLIKDQTQFTILAKTSDVAHGQSIKFWFDFISTDELFAHAGNGNDKIRFMAKTNDTTHFNSDTTNDYPSSGDLYVVMCCDGSETMGGFTTTKPTKKSDFAAGDRVTAAAADVFSYAMGTRRHFMGSTAGAYKLAGKCWYVLVSNTCLIDMGS